VEVTLELKIIESESDGISEDGLISLLSTGSCDIISKPVPDKALALQALDFWVEEWWIRGVEILSAELHTNFDPEDGVWFFTIELTCENSEDIDSFLDKEFNIFDAMVENSSCETWWRDYSVSTKRVGD
jgi:hypothetical protein